MLIQIMLRFAVYAFLLLLVWPRRSARKHRVAVKVCSNGHGAAAWR